MILSLKLFYLVLNSSQKRCYNKWGEHKDNSEMTNTSLFLF